MNHYAKLGTVAIRLVAIAFFVLTLVSGVFALGVGSMGSMMAQGQPGMGSGMGSLMQGGMRMWWAPMLVNLVIAVLLYAVSRPLGKMIGAGLDE